MPQGWNNVVHASDCQEEVWQPCLTRREVHEFYTGTSLEVWFMCWPFGYFKKSNLGEKAKLETVKRFLWILHNSPQNILYIFLMKVKLDNLITVWDWKYSRMENVWHALCTRR